MSVASTPPLLGGGGPPPPANLKVHAGEVVNKEKRKMAGVHLLTELGDRFAGGLRI